MDEIIAKRGLDAEPRTEEIIPVTVRLTKAQSAFLDALRFFAAFMVLVTHLLAHFYDQAYAPYRKHYYTNLGSLGVGIFFVLSGFLIAYSVFRKKAASETYSLEIYMVERFTRIYAVLAPAMLLAVVLNIVNELFRLGADPTRFTIYHFLTTILMLQGVHGITAHGETFALLEPSWSLNYEFFFYVIYGAIALRLLPLSGTRDRIMRYLLIAATVLIATRLDSAYHFAYNWILGAVMAWLFVKGIQWKSLRSRLAFIVLVLVSYFVLFLLMRGDVGAWLTATFIGLLIYGLLMLVEGFSVPKGFMQASKLLSSYSYTMYLIHYGIIHLVYLFCLKHHVLSGDGRDSWLRLNIVLVLMLLINAASYLFSLLTEKKTDRLRSLIIRYLPGTGDRALAATYLTTR